MNGLVHEFRTEQLLFWRSRELAFFTFLLPIVFFVLLGSVYGKDKIEHVKGSRYLLAGMLGYGVIATAFAGVAITLVIRRESGVLKRLRGTPLPAWAYVGGVLGSTIAVYRARGARAGRARQGRSSACPSPSTSCHSCSRCSSARSRSRHWASG